MGVVVEQKGEKFAVAWLREGKVEFCGLDLFVESKEAKLSVIGKATVHLTGYFEAEEDDESMEDATPPKKASPKVEGKSSSPKLAAPAEKKVSPKAEAQAPAVAEE